LEPTQRSLKTRRPHYEHTDIPDVACQHSLINRYIRPILWFCQPATLPSFGRQGDAFGVVVGKLTKKITSPRATPHLRPLEVLSLFHSEPIHIATVLTHISSSILPERSIWLSISSRSTIGKALPLTPAKSHL
ncbi:hypothetical protein KCV00_g415, partial [Aureobasidium melanogenum]